MSLLVLAPMTLGRSPRPLAPDMARSHRALVVLTRNDLA